MHQAICPFFIGAAVLAAVACGGGATDAGGNDVNADQTTGGGTATTGGGGAGGAGGTATTGGATTDPGGTSSPSGDPANGSGQAKPGEPELELWRPIIYTGTDGTHTYDIPVATVLVSYPADPNVDGTPVAFPTPPTFALADETIATGKAIATPTNPAIQKNPFLSAASFAVVSPKKAGDTTLTVTYGTQKVSAKVHVTAYTAAQYTLGQQRYATPANAGALRVACTQCHNPASAGADAGAPPHDPFLQQDLSDAELVGIVTKGLYDVNDPASALEVPGGHSWNLTAEEQAALPAYLRSLHSLGF